MQKCSISSLQLVERLVDTSSWKQLSLARLWAQKSLALTVVQWLAYQPGMLETPVRIRSVKEFQTGAQKLFPNQNVSVSFTGYLIIIIFIIVMIIMIYIMLMLDCRLQSMRFSPLVAEKCLMIVMVTLQSSTRNILDNSTIVNNQKCVFSDI